MPKATFGKTTRGRFPSDAETWRAAGMANTLNAFDLARIAENANEVVEEEECPAETRLWALDGDKLGKAERRGGGGWGVAQGDVMYTLTVKDVHGVALALPRKGGHRPKPPVARYYAPTPNALAGACEDLAAGTLTAMCSKQVNNQNPLLVEIGEASDGRQG